MIATIAPHKPVVYPVSDGKPVAETELHFRAIIELFQILNRHYAARSDVYVGANNFVYFEEGNLRACISPDGYVVFGVQKKVRDCYKAWEENGRVPSIVFEFTSRKTKAEDLGDKKVKCSTMGVAEYFLFDPRSEYLRPALQGFRLNRGNYESISTDSKGRVHSSTLDLDFSIDRSLQLNVYDPAKKAMLPSMDEQLAKAETEKHAAEAAQRTAEAEIARLREELARIKNA